MTVEAADLPACIDASEMRKGMPMPLAKPMQAEPSRVPGQPPKSVSSRKPSRKRTGASSLHLRPMARRRWTNSSPPTKATRSAPAMMTAMHWAGTAPSAVVSRAKLAG